VGLLLLTFVAGREVNGQRLTLAIGPFSGQPSELLKVILVVFLAGYLSENRALLVEQSTRLGPVRLPPLPYLAPMVAMWAIALSIVVVQRDLGAALLFFAVFLLLLYVTTGRASFVALGLVAFVASGAVLYEIVPHVRTRVDIWVDPFATASGAGYQVVQALHAFARGGILGTGLGAGLPEVGSLPPGGIPALHTDFPFAALGEELGLIGVMAILGLYLVVIERGLRIAASAGDDFRAILAAGLSLVIGVQAFIIAAGNLKLIPLTGITLPFISYGGSSLLTNGVVVGLLIALSDRGVEPPPPPTARRGIRRVFDRGAP
jgi:cell division protein FtsW (lipid II flippase)